MDENGTILADLLQVDDELGGIVLGVRENFCAEEGDDMIRNYWNRLIAEISVIDTQLGVKPVDFVWNEFSWNKTLQCRVSIRIGCGGVGI